LGKIKNDEPVVYNYEVVSKVLTERVA